MLSCYLRYFSFMQVAFADMAKRLRLERLAGDTSNLEPAGDGSEWSSWHDPKFWADFRKECEAIDLDSATAQIDRIVSELKSTPDMRRSELERLFDDLRNRIHDQLGSRWFLYVPLAKAPYWENEDRFGEDVSQKIADARHDIYEACSCFAVGRNDATVYHCIGIMQAALFKLAVALNSERIDLDVDDWGSVISKLQKAVNALEATAKAHSSDPNIWAEWKRLEPKYNEIISDANAVKKAWRHTTAHFRQRYEPEQAEKVLDKVGDFVRDVADLLP
jgi:thymidylate synthase